MKSFIITLCISGLLLGFFNTVNAADFKYIPLVGLPIPTGLETSGNETYTTQDYIKILYALSISIAALLAVVKIIFGGLKYMLSDVVTDKAGAKKDIRGALLGLLIVIGAVLILNTINPQLTQFTTFGNAINSQSAVGSTNDSNKTAPSLNDIISDPNDPRFNSTPYINECDTEGTISCLQLSQNCAAVNGIAQQTGPGSLTCFTRYDGSTIHIPKADPNVCNGYRDAQTQVCYDNTIQLGTEFAGERQDIRSMECLRLGGRYSIEEDVCYGND